MAEPTYDHLTNRLYVPTDVDRHSRMIRDQAARDLAGRDTPEYVRSWMDSWYATSRAMAIKAGEIPEDWPE